MREECPSPGPALSTAMPCSIKLRTNGQEAYTVYVALALAYPAAAGIPLESPPESPLESVPTQSRASNIAAQPATTLTTAFALAPRRRRRGWNRDWNHTLESKAPPPPRLESSFAMPPSPLGLRPRPLPPAPRWNRLESPTRRRRCRVRFAVRAINPATAAGIRRESPQFGCTLFKVVPLQFLTGL